MNAEMDSDDFKVKLNESQTEVLKVKKELDLSQV